MTLPGKKRTRPPLDMSNLPRGLSPAEAAQVAGVSIDTYYRHIHPHVVNGEILSLHIGKQRRILTASLLAWLEQRAKAERQVWR